MFWVTERDPMFDTIRTDPAYLELVELENSRMANQRRLLEDMRAAGQVPRRWSPRLLVARRGHPWHAHV